MGGVLKDVVSTNKSIRNESFWGFTKVQGSKEFFGESVLDFSKTVNSGLLMFRYVRVGNSCVTGAFEVGRSIRIRSDSTDFEGVKIVCLW